MLIVFDIGNTNTVIGCFGGTSELLFELRLKTDPARTVDETSALLDSLLRRRLGDSYHIERAIISSVVPPVTPEIAKMIESMFGVEPLIVGPGIKTGIAIKIQEPNSVGADRVVNAVAAKALFGMPALVIDFGTATSFDVISSEGNYEGGAIVPGVVVALDSLVRNTAKLPRIELSWPKQVVGKNTISAMQTGSVVGYLCLVDGLIDRIIEEVGPIKHIVATGGLGRLFAEHSNRISSYDPHLTLKGLKIIAELNQP